MAGIKKIISDRFWNILQEIDGLEADCPLEVFKDRFEDEDISHESVLEVVHFLKKFDYPICMKKVGGQAWLTLTGERKSVLIEMSFSNWLSVQAHAPFVKELENKAFHENLMECLQGVEKKYPKFDLSLALAPENPLEVVPFDKRVALGELNRAITNRDIVLVYLSNNKKYECYPHRVLYIDGDLTFVGEEVTDRCLVSYSFNEVERVKTLEDVSYQANFMSPEIDDFIYAIRAITGNEERLVLKIRSPENVNLKPDYQFLGNPYITVNTDGDFIWAASVDISDELFSWMESIQNDIEILDPVDLQDQFLEYLEHKNRKQAA